jgi:type I restriction enzyme S subunit
MRKYPKLKDSGVEWIGKIPNHWEVSRCKWIFISVNEKGHPNEPLLSVTQDKSLVRRDENEQRVWNPTSDISGYKLVLEEDFVISLRSFEGGIEFSSVRGIVSPAYSVFRSLNPNSNEFNKHLFKSKDFISALNTLTTGIRQGKNISYEDFSSLLIPIPPLPEQQQIVTYLDHKTTLIDQIISGSEKKIELLQEKRTATINHAVTKGLNPKVKMKDSGVEWIGEIPEGWEVGKFNYYISIRHGYQFRDYDFTEEGIKVVKITQLHKDGYLDLSNCSFIDDARLSSFEDIVIQERDILMCLTGGTIGKIIRVGTVTEPLVQNYRVGHFSSKNEEVILNDYLFLLMTSNVINGQIFYEIRETGQPNIGIEDFRKMKITIPPIKEQQQIVTYLDQKTKEIDDLIASEKKRIELLKEYRQSLISEVVTGKIKVTNH